MFLYGCILAFHLLVWGRMLAHELLKGLSYVRCSSSFHEVIGRLDSQVTRPSELLGKGIPENHLRLLRSQMIDV